VILSLPNSHVAVHVLENDVLPAVERGCVVIDMGTTLVRDSRRLCGAFRERGVELLDAPVSGGTVGAARGELYVFVGGDRAAAESRWDILSVLGGARLTWCGESGCGQVTKAVNQLAMGLVDAAFLEAISFGVNGGVDAQTLSDAVGGGDGFRAHLRRIAERVAAGDGDANDVKYAELAYFLDFARDQRFPTPMLDGLSRFLSERAETRRDNMNRPYPPFWSALTAGPETSQGSAI
jgi:3-hydroxyisobutyrate dehydrogenase-like beta-hydroxyacid dehydrogenase